jgi:hypothetical protein
MNVRSLCMVWSVSLVEWGWYENLGHVWAENVDWFELSLKLPSVSPSISASFTPYPLFQWYLQSKEILLNLGMRCWNSIFNAQGLRVIIVVVQVGAVNIYVTAVQALRKMETQDETQFTTKFGGKTSLGHSYSFCKIFIPSYVHGALLCQNWPFLAPNCLTLSNNSLCRVRTSTQTGLFWEFGLCTWFTPERGRLLILRRVLFRRVLTQPLEFCFDNGQLWFCWEERREEDRTLHISFLEVPPFVKAEFLLRRRFPPHTVK